MQCRRVEVVDSRLTTVTVSPDGRNVSVLIELHTQCVLSHQQNHLEIAGTTRELREWVGELGLMLADADSVINYERPTG